MAVNPLRAFLLVVAGAISAAVIAYFSGAFDSFVSPPPTAVARLPEPASAPSGGADAVTPASPAAPAAPPAGETPPPQAEVVPPSFDIVRVEPDGSIVVAGRAEPGSAVELLTGSTVLGSTTAGADGDFAVVLDEPLAPGGHQIVLRGTSPGNVVAMSPETAVVSIPDRPDGQVLAMVEQPGEASRLITVPEPPAAAGAAPANDPAASATVAAPEASAAPSAEAAPATPEAGASQPAQPAGEASEGSETPAASDSAPAVAALDPAPAPAPQAAPAAEPSVAVEAVEIEGRDIFVAGRGEPGHVVRVYANDELLGEAPASNGGRFLVETKRDLPVGSYIIRADLLEQNGAKVIARAAVPFEREAGESIAAVAPPAPAAAAAPAVAQTEPAAPASEAAPAEPAAPAAEAAQAEAVAEPAAPADAAPEAVASGDASTGPSGQGTVTGQDAQEVAAEATEEAQASPGSAGPATGASEAPPSATAQAPADAAEMAAADTAQTPAAEAPAGSSAPQVPATAAQEPAAPAGEAVAIAPAAGTDAAPAQPEPAAPGAAPETPAATSEASQVDASTPAPSEVTVPDPGLALATEPPTITGEALQNVDGAVIIRRGDSLWRISRRVYGRGVRYSTIYLANQDQIEDPNRIWPGQVFKVPEKTSEGEAADMSNLAGQAVKP